MNRPSGDHTGFARMPSASRTGSPPPTGTLKRGLASPALAMTAIQPPSGDQDGESRTSRASERMRALVPSDDMA